MDAGLISSQDLALGALWRLPTAIQMRKGQMQGPNFPVLCILHVEKSALNSVLLYLLEYGAMFKYVWKKKVKYPEFALNDQASYYKVAPVLDSKKWRICSLEEASPDLTAVLYCITTFNIPIWAVDSIILSGFLKKASVFILYALPS